MPPLTEFESPSLVQLLRGLDERIAIWRRFAKEALARQPDNPKIKRIGESPNCFTIRSKDLGGDWSPEFHDWRWQYKFIGDLLDGEPHAVAAKLQTIASCGRLRVGCATYTFAPQVREAIQRIFFGEESKEDQCNSIP